MTFIFYLPVNKFLETLCINDGVPQHLPWHQQRVGATFRACIHGDTPFLIEDVLAEYDIPQTGILKCTILYSPQEITVNWSNYVRNPITKLKLIEVPEEYDYRYKYADRKVIDELFAERGDADDILMTRGGWITDTSIANIAFRKDDRWYTPAQPLLAGTTWKRLIAEGRLIPRPIHQSEFGSFDAFRIFNALHAF